MQRQSILLMLVVLLLGIVFSREPRLQRTEEIFLHWLIDYSPGRANPVPLTIVEVAGKSAGARDASALNPTEKFLRGSSSANSPLEYALLIQALMEFKPTIVAFEPVLLWRENAKDAQQVVTDQMMRVPKVVLATELTATPDPDASVVEISGFTLISGKRGDLMSFSGISRQPDEDLRLISTPGFTVPARETINDLSAPLVLQYRGDLIPSFPLQTAMLWLKLTAGEVRVDIGNSILLTNDKKIPVRTDGTAMVNPNAARGARHIGLNALLLAAQQHEKKPANPAGATVATPPAKMRQAATADSLANLPDQIVLIRTMRSPFEGPDMLAATIASIQTNSFIHRVSWIFDCVILFVIVALIPRLQKFSRIDLLLGAIAFSAAYSMIALTVFARWNLWLPGFLPIGAAWSVVIFSLFTQKPRNSARTVAVAPPPPVP